MNGQKPEALRLAEYLFESAQFHPQLSEDEQGGYASEFDMVLDEAAAELRRLHEVNAELMQIFKRIRFEQCFVCECGIEDATWELIEANIAKATGEQR
jgi:hypothetical protein